MVEVRKLFSYSYPVNIEKLPPRSPCNGRITKRHLNAFLQFIRNRGVKCVWVLEFQAREAPHHHVITSHFIPREEIAKRWYKIVGSGDEESQRQMGR